MSKKLFLAGAAALSFAMAPQAAHALSITYEANGQLPGYTTAAVVQSFDGSKPAFGSFTTLGGTTIAGSRSPSSDNFVATVSGTGSSPLPHAQPFGASGTFGSYLAVGPKSGSPASYTLSFTGTAVHFLSFVFGSLDQSNQVILTLADNTVQTLTGGQILGSSLPGSYPYSTTAAAGRVSFNFDTAALKSIQFLQTDSQYTFEIDEIALAAPEPATWAMMLLGFGLVGSQLRRRSRKPAQALATA